MNRAITINVEADLIAARGARNAVDPHVPYAFLVEPEYSSSGRVEDVATIFLTNRECPFKCVYCDLWKNTTPARVSAGAIPGQIDYALARLPPARHIKLYNSGNFFDPQAIPPEDFPAIAARVQAFETVIVENHPRLCGPACLGFRNLLPTTCAFDVALGLETAHAEVLARLNKQMTLDDFRRAADGLRRCGMGVRAFILLKPPYMEDSVCVEWAVRSLEFAFDAGAECCVLIPTRGGNGYLDQLQRAGEFAPPTLTALEQALDAGLQMGRGRVFADLWNIEQLAACRQCGPPRAARLNAMNLGQCVLPPEITCCP